MPMHRSNKAPRSVGRSSVERWFPKHKQRTRMRKKMARKSRQRNRK